jgi:hypothetical protein
LSSIELLQIRKIKEHVYSKILKFNDNSLQNDSNVDKNSSTDVVAASTSSTLNSKNDDMISVAEKSIDIYCSDQVIK